VAAVLIIDRYYHNILHLTIYACGCKVAVRNLFRDLTSFLLLCVKLQYAVDICFQNTFCVMTLT
jgi:hypothetical protein